MAQQDKPEYDQIESQYHAVLVAGFGRVGQIVGRLLRIANEPFTALEIDSGQVDVVRRYGSKVHYGDASKIDILRAAGAEHAKLFILTIDDVEASVHTAQSVSRHFPHLTIIARARNRRHEYKLMDLGIEHIFRETLLSSVALSKRVLIDLGVEQEKVQQIADLFLEKDRRLILEQHAIAHDEQRLIQSARETARELDSLLSQDLQS